MNRADPPPGVYHWAPVRFCKCETEFEQLTRENCCEKRRGWRSTGQILKVLEFKQLSCKNCCGKRRGWRSTGQISKCETEFEQLSCKNCCERKKEDPEHGLDFRSVKQNSNSWAVRIVVKEKGRPGKRVRFYKCETEFEQLRCKNCCE